MLFRGLLIAASGFVFIFSPGVPIRLLTQRAQAVRRNFLIWGIVIWLLALLPSLFFQSIMRQIWETIQGSEPEPGYGITLAGAILAAFFLQGLIFLFLWWHQRRNPDSYAPSDGLHLGFGVGMVAQVFTGLNLVGAGFRLSFGSTEGSTLSAMASTPLATLIMGLLAMILFRVALLAISAALGVLVARAVKERRLFWLAILLNALFAWLILALQLALGSDSPGLMLAGTVDLGTSLISVAYFALAFTLAYRWIQGQPNLDRRRPKKMRKKR